MYVVAISPVQCEDEGPEHRVPDALNGDPPFPSAVLLSWQHTEEEAQLLEGTGFIYSKMQFPWFKECNFNLHMTNQNVPYLIISQLLRYSSFTGSEGCTNYKCYMPYT